MPDQTNPDDPRRHRLDEVIGAFLVVLDAGENPNPDEWMARHPELSPELAEFFADRERVDEVVEPLRKAPDTTTHVAFSHSTTGGDRDASAALPKGTRVRYFGDYELEKVLGEGGMGIVYKARQISLNRAVALKMIRTARFASDDDLRRFQNEAEAVARLDHPNIVPIFEVGQFEDQHYFSMKLIAGERLDKRLKDYVADPRRAARLVAVTAGAIHHAHQRGILHRDLKPANILIDSDGHPHVTDFGLAKRVDRDSELTRSGAIVGTPAYMAPEQASGSRGAVTTSTDVYELGAVLFALLTGRAPFGGATVLDTLEQVRERPPEPLRKLNPRVPRDLEVISLKCLEKDPRRRYASADALDEDLKRWLAGEPIAARPVGNAARAWMWCRRNPIVAGAAALVAASLVAASLLSLLYANEQYLRATEQAEASATISGLNVSLEKERNDLKTSVADLNRRLAMLCFERAQRAFDSGQVNHGLLWLAETWRYALQADDRAWQHLARANLSYWRYQDPEIRSAVSHYLACSPDGKTILAGGEGTSVRLWDVDSARPIGQPMVPEEGLIRSPVFSRDCKTIVTTGGAKTARLWDAATGLLVGQPLVHQDFVTSTAFSPDGKIVLTGSMDRTARLWDARTGRPIGGPMVHHDPVWSAVFSPDGKTILTEGSGKAARLWNAASGQPVGKPLEHQNSSSLLQTFSPDSKTVLTAGSDRTARLWDAATGLPIGPPMVHQAFIQSAAFSPDGKTIVTGSSDMSARLWDAVTALPIGPPLENEGSPWSPQETHVSFSPDSKTFVVRNSGGASVRLGNSATGLPVGKPLEHQGRVSSVAFSPDGKTVATGSWDRMVRLWDAATGLPVGPAIMHKDAVIDVAFSHEGTAIVTRTADGTARKWNATTGSPLGQPVEFPSRAQFTFSPDGDRVLTVGEEVAEKAQLWDVSTGLRVGQSMEDPDAIRGAAFSPDGKTILTVSQSNTLRRWSAATGRPVGQHMDLGEITGQPPAGQLPSLQLGISLMYSPDGRSFVTIDFGRTAQLWKADSGQSIMSQTDALVAVFSPDAKVLVTGGTDKKARLWDASTGQSIGQSMEHQGAVLTAAFSPDGKTVLTGSDDKKARLWYAASGQPIGQALVHQAAVRSVAFNRGGKTILTMPNNAMRVWDVATSRLIGQPIVQGINSRWAFSPDMNTILTGGFDSPARLWDAATGQPIGPPLLQHQEKLIAAAYSPDGITIATESVSAAEMGSGFGDPSTARLWHLPAPMDDDFPRIKVWVETTTGLVVDDEGKITTLGTEAWQVRSEQLRQLGGPPKSDSRWLFDPILYGPDPTARARAWVERKCWVEAEAAFAEVIRARPLRAAVWAERGRFYAMRLEPAKAAADFARALVLGDRPSWALRSMMHSVTEGRDPILLADLVADAKILDRVLTLLPADLAALSVELLFRRAEHLAQEGRLDLARAVIVRAGALPWLEAKLSIPVFQRAEMFAALGCAEQVSYFLRNYQRTKSASVANSLAWYCVLAPNAVDDPDAPVRFAELAVKRFPAEQKHLALNTLGEALYRAGRFQDAIRRLVEGIKGRKGTEEPADWTFLAMAHHRLGHREETRRWLDKLRNHHPSTDPNRFWDELEIRLLRSEAEAVILYDPVFPANPFAR